jgi:FAD/FMN-containing dehydrogenase
VSDTATTAIFANIADVATSTDASERALLSGDIAGASPHAARAILRPANLDAVCAIVAEARREGISLHPRGGGWSYTGGYSPSARGAIVDTSALDRIEIDREAETVTAGAGATWARLYDALDAVGRRVTSFGPLSGIGATVGGATAQNGGFFGAAGNGAFGDGVIRGGTIVTGTSEPYRLESDDRADGIAAPQPLVGDCGAFGIRTDVTLRTITRPPATLFASFHFPTGAIALEVLSRLPGLPALGDAYVFDPGTHANLARTGFSVIESAAIAGDLLGAGGGLLGRVSGLLRTARAGKAFMADLAWTLHVVLEGSASEAAATLADITRRVAAAGGEVIPDVIPRVTRARPFRRIKALLGPDGEAWLPVHGVFRADQVQAALATVEALFADQAGEMKALGVRGVTLAVLMGARTVIEPQLFWPDALSDVVRRMATPDQVAAYGTRPPNHPARSFAHTLRKQLLAALDASGASHFQIGRSYAAHPGVSDQVRAAWTRLKTRFDPDGIMNPGVLGL